MRLIIAEKPSVARSIASVLGATQKRNGFYEGNGNIVSWCAGHLLELAAPDAYGEYTKWRYEDLPIIPNEWKHTALKGKAAQLKILKELMKRPDVDCVVNACDAGREGENIFRLVYEYAKCNKKTMRLWISSLEDAAVRAGFNNLKDGKDYDNLYAAASCRERADWAVGLNTTRAFTCLYGGSTLNVGRVQSPTLAMLVKRESDIAGFIKESFYMVNINHDNFTAVSEKTKERQEAETIRAACNGKTAVVRSLERKKKTAAPPNLYDLTTLQRESNRIFGFTAAQTLEYVQSLYEKKLLTYPRVDSRYLTSDMRGTAEEIILRLQRNATFTGGAEFKPDIDRLIDDKKVSDHHAVIPTFEMFEKNLSVLPSGERDIVNLVVNRMLCAAAPVYVYEAVTAVLDCGGYSFTAKGKVVIEEGWKAVESAFKASLKVRYDGGDDEDNEDGDLSELSKGQTFDSITASVKEGVTTPPRPYTEDTLLSAMENAGAEETGRGAECLRGLGTPATRAAIIEKLIKSGFVLRQKKNLVPTEKGKRLIAVLPDTLTSPKLTAEWENRLMAVQKGELPEAGFMDGITAFITAVIKENNAPKPEFAGLFGGNNAENEPCGVCPRCGSAVREFAKGFFCDTASCGFKMWKESKFWTAKKKPLTAEIAAALLKDRRIDLKGLHSEKTGKKYDATVILDDTSDGYVNYKLEFK
jgi:DNA topoisomerase-3